MLAACGGGSYFLRGSWLPSDLVKPKSLKRTKKFIQHQSDCCIKIKGNWQIPRDIDYRELEVLLMSNQSYCAEVAHNDSSRNRKVIVERAAQLAIRPQSQHQLLHSEENE
ncbi:60S ribosomal protein L32 [Tupaia chinensis]|uniref:60S ribosomal protein L32 n=1 Tax=Tupaia chinensis TaxID=246437 RepID=L9KMU1_TUPCH|nr:60S ribosomal protein L32 [Tupaia chinensis]